MGRIKEAYYNLKDLVVNLLEDGINEVDLDDFVKVHLENPVLYGFYLDNKESLLDEIHADTGKELDELDESLDPGNITPAAKNYYECLRIASELIEAGLDPYEIDDEMEHMLSEEAYEYWLVYKTDMLKDLGADDQENYFEDSLRDYDTDDEEEWIDPAGGTHYGREEDPAKMYEVLVGKEKQQERFIDLRGPSGNAYVILGMAKNLADQLKKADPKKFNWEQINAEMTAGDYNNLVRTFDRYFGDYVTIYGADVLDPKDDEDVDENCSESEKSLYIMPLLEGCNCGGVKKPKPRPRPKPAGTRLHEIASMPPPPPAGGKPNRLLEDNSGDARKVAQLIAEQKRDEKYIIPPLK